jgi:SAM-dependent methyltransferase
MFTDADAAVLYDLLSPWDAKRFASDAFYDEWVMAAGSVLDVGCGTGSMLCQARRVGHAGRLVGLDPNRAALARAADKIRIQSTVDSYRDVEWVVGVAADAGRWDREFELATMVSHAFQLLVTDDDLHASLSAIRAALEPGGRFVFETRHPQAREWEEWTPDNPADVVDDEDRMFRVVYQVEDVAGDVVTFTETSIDWDPGDVLRVDRSRLRFLDVPTLDGFLTAAGFEVEERYGDWHRGPLTDASREIITVARRR